MTVGYVILREMFSAPLKALTCQTNREENARHWFFGIAIRKKTINF